MKLRSSLILPALLLGVTTAYVGCAKKPANVRLRNRSAASLLADGERALKLGNWEEGRKTLRLLEGNMPSSRSSPRRSS